MNSIAEQTALIAEMESGNGFHQLAVARDRIIVGPAGRYADDVAAAARALSRPAKVVLAAAVAAAESIVH